MSKRRNNATKFARVLVGLHPETSSGFELDVEGLSEALDERNRGGGATLSWLHWNDGVREVRNWDYPVEAVALVVRPSGVRSAVSLLSELALDHLRRNGEEIDGEPSLCVEIQREVDWENLPVPGVLDRLAAI